MKSFSFDLLPHRVLAATAILLAACGASTAGAEEEKQTGSAKRPRIGVVLAGGGALGIAHIGVLRVLEELRVPVHAITGASMGAIVGGAYSAGRSLEEMEEVITTTNWGALFSEGTDRRLLPYRMKPGKGREILGDGKFGIKDGAFAAIVGLIQGQRIRPVFQRLYRTDPNPSEFSNLPFRAVAADIETGEPVVIGSGDMATAVRASMSVPGAFAPVEIDGKLLVDGGIANNLPVDVALGLDCDVLIVVELFADLKDRKELTNALAISGQMISLLLAQNSALQRKLMRPQDILIVPEIKGYTPMDFNKAQDLLARGEAAAREQAARLRLLSVSEGEYAAYQRERAGKPQSSPRLEFVRVENDIHELDQEVTQSLTLKEGDVFDRAVIEQDIEKIYRLGMYSQVQYELVQEDGRTGLVVRAAAKDWSEQYFRSGISIEDDFEGNPLLALALAYRMNALNHYGAWAEIEGELGSFPRLYLDFYQPVQPSSPFFVEGELELRRKNIPVRVNGEVLAEYGSREGSGAIKFGRSFDEYGEFYVGLRRGEGSLKREIGDPSLEDGDYDIGEAVAGLLFDQLDSPDFPRAGYLATGVFSASREDLGASEEFDRLVANFALPLTFGQNTLTLGLQSGITFNDIGARRSFNRGGFFDISGYERFGLLASDYGTARLAVYRKLTQFGGDLFGLSLFGGGTLEWSKLMNDDERLDDYPSLFSGSVFVGVDTPLAPAYFGFGMAEEGELSGYLALGRLLANRR